jgi:hypothetical protein
MTIEVIQPDMTAPRYRPYSVQHSDKTGRLHAADVVPLTECRVTCDKIRHANVVEDIIVTLSRCKRLGHAPLHSGEVRRPEKDKAQAHTGKTGLSNTTLFFRGHRVLRSDRPNHVNLRIHYVHQ